MRRPYVHGYDRRENIRLQDQAKTLAELLHSDTFYQDGEKVLEAGCGVGAQTITLASKSPGASIVSIDISEESVKETKRKVEKAGLINVSVMEADIFELPFQSQEFDHLFLCFVLEHLHQPVDVLVGLKKYLKPGGTITVIEGDHGSAYFYPDGEAARRAIACQVELQRRSGGNANIGRALYPLLTQAGFKDIRVSPRMVYADSNKPELVEGFTRKTFTAMIEGIRESALASNLIEAEIFDRGIEELYRTAEKDGVFCYTFFKATGKRNEAT